jgi:uncharacterized protein (DUF342 family)
MSTAVHDAAVHVQVAGDKLTAQMVVPADMAPNLLTDSVCFALLRQAGVEISEQIQQRVRALLQQVAADPHVEHQAVVAQARPAKHGQDGRLEWLIEDLAPSDAGNFYERSAYILVKPGQVLARIHNPSEGEDGRDVTGKTLTARSGQPVKLELDDTILRNGQGQLIAQAEGVLFRESGKVCVRKLIEVPEYVDFSTGNIDFKGDILVQRGVRDCFKVKAAGDIEVHGLIEAASITCNGSLRALGGFAGRERGYANVGKDLIAKYIDNVHGRVGNDLIVEREILNSGLQVKGNLACPHGTVIGGRLAVAGHIDLESLGSDAAVLTELVLGDLPVLAQAAAQLPVLIQQFMVRCEQIMHQLQQMAKLTSKPGSITDQRRNALQGELKHVNDRLLAANQVLDNLNARAPSDPKVRIHVAKRIFPGVLLTVRSQRFRFHTELKGPVTLRYERGAMIYEPAHGPPAKLAQVCDVNLR